MLILVRLARSIDHYITAHKINVTCALEPVPSHLSVGSRPAGLPSLHSNHVKVALQARFITGVHDIARAGCGVIAIVPYMQPTELFNLS